MDEVGGLQQPDDYLGRGGKLLFSIPLTAENEGELTFSSRRFSGTGTRASHIELSNVRRHLKRRWLKR